jgi:hypothetical protein
MQVTIFSLILAIGHVEGPSYCVTVSLPWELPSVQQEEILSLLFCPIGTNCSICCLISLFFFSNKFKIFKIFKTSIRAIILLKTVFSKKKTDYKSFHLVQSNTLTIKIFLNVNWLTFFYIIIHEISVS